jgi:hypothetical protein
VDPGHQVRAINHTRCTSARTIEHLAPRQPDRVAALHLGEEVAVEVAVAPLRRVVVQTPVELDLQVQVVPRIPVDATQTADGHVLSLRGSFTNSSSVARQQGAVDTRPAHGLVSNLWTTAVWWLLWWSRLIARWRSLLDRLVVAVVVLIARCSTAFHVRCTTSGRRDAWEHWSAHAR